MPLANDAQGCGMAHCPCLILPKAPGAELVRQSMAITSKGLLRYIIPGERNEGRGGLLMSLEGDV